MILSRQFIENIEITKLSEYRIDVCKRAKIIEKLDYILRHSSFEPSDADNVISYPKGP